MSGSQAAAPTATSGNITFGTNEFRDIYLGADGNLVILTGYDALAQDCVSALSAQLGEMVLQPTAGMPTLDTVWQYRNFPAFEAAARKILTSISGVVRVVSFNFQQQGQNFFYVAVIKTIYGPKDLQLVGTLLDAINNFNGTGGTTQPEQPPSASSLLDSFILDVSVLG